MEINCRNFLATTCSGLIGGSLGAFAGLVVEIFGKTNHEWEWPIEHPQVYNGIIIGLAATGLIVGSILGRKFSGPVCNSSANHYVMFPVERNRAADTVLNIQEATPSSAKITLAS
jgi:hypothetical protein